MMATERNTMMINIDYDALYKWAEDNKMQMSQVSRELGFNSGYFTNARLRNRLPKNVYKFLLLRYGLPEGSFIKKEPEPEPTRCNVQYVEDTVVKVDTLLPKLEELNTSINKLGNIMMQMLEYVKEIRDEVK